MPLHDAPIAPNGPEETAALLRLSGDGDTVTRRRVAILRRFNELLAADRSMTDLTDDDFALRQRFYLERACADIVLGVPPFAVAAD